jgi:hypothetical protein
VQQRRAERRRLVLVVGTVPRLARLQSAPQIAAECFALP